MATPFSSIYNKFLGMITDDMYLEITEAETLADCKSLLLNVISKFEYPKFKLYDFDEVLEVHNADLTDEEKNILAQLMMVGWIQRQLTSVDVTRMKYSGTDFKFTSQANHMEKLLKLLTSAEEQDNHLQKLYGRRKFADGYATPNLSSIMGRSAL